MYLVVSMMLWGQHLIITSHVISKPTVIPSKHLIGSFCVLGSVNWWYMFIGHRIILAGHDQANFLCLKLVLSHNFSTYISFYMTNSCCKMLT